MSALAMERFHTIMRFVSEVEVRVVVRSAVGVEVGVGITLSHR